MEMEESTNRWIRLDPEWNISASAIDVDYQDEMIYWIDIGDKVWRRKDCSVQGRGGREGRGERRGEVPKQEERGGEKEGEREGEGRKEREKGREGEGRKEREKGREEGEEDRREGLFSLLIPFLSHS